MRAPDFSIIVPTYNRPANLERCLGSLQALDYPKIAFEVIVVDDGSQIRPDKIVAAYENRLRLTLLRQENVGPAAARNAGARAALGRYLVFTDDDCALQEDFLRNLSTLYADHPDAAIGGHTRNALTDNIFSTASQMLMDYLSYYFNDKCRHGAFGTTSNLSLPRETFTALKGFSAQFRLPGGEDRELIDRWLHLGHKYIHAPEAVVWHYHDLQLRTFLQQHKNYGRGAFHFHELRSAWTDEGIKVEPPSFYFGITAYPFRRGSIPRSVALSILLNLTQVMNTLGYFAEARETRTHRRRANKTAAGRGT